MLPKHLFATAATFSSLLGCSVGPDYVRPIPALPEQYIGQKAVEQRDAKLASNLEAWWEGFGDTQLTKLVSESLRQNLSLAQAAARVDQAQAGLGAANAALLPSGNIDGQAGRARQTIETPLGQVLSSTPGFNRYGSSYEANLNASWEVDLFGGLRRDREAALAEYRASEAGEIAVRLAVSAQTADLYIVIRGLQTRLEIAHLQVQTQRDLVSKVRQLNGVGLAADREVQQAEGALAQVEATVPVLESSLDAAMNALDVVLGTPPGTHRAELECRSNIPLAPGFAGMGSPQDLLRRRPDLIVAERHLSASNARIGSAIAEYYPKFSLTGLLGSATSVSSGHLFSNDASQAAAVFGLRWRIFDFSRINSQIALAKGQEAEALATYRLAALAATEDVENALSELVKREQQAKVLEQGEQSLGHARASTFSAYENGVVSLIEVLNADQSLLAARDNRAQAQTESARAAVAAFKALGGGWQSNHVSDANGQGNTEKPQSAQADNSARPMAPLI
ncbi:efflux transporter outer membrane subunit [Pseudomonas sp. NY15435]|uniref:efflux transporter outer membrane subunit n=1 Tax=Pseudomonas sp. NY15435 TaxID=3400358 RepID=UPI003A89A1B5